MDKERVLYVLQMATRHQNPNNLVFVRIESEGMIIDPVLSEDRYDLRFNSAWAG